MTVLNILQTFIATVHILKLLDFVAVAIWWPTFIPHWFSIFCLAVYWFCNKTVLFTTEADDALCLWQCGGGVGGRGDASAYLDGQSTGGK